jgi:sensor histidine kinase YesM
VELSAGVVFADSVIFWTLFSFVGLSLWYLVYYNNLEKDILSFAMFHVVTACAAIGILVFKSWIILSFFFEGNPYYSSFYHETLYLRAIMATMSYVTVVLFYYAYIFYQDIRENKAREERYKTLLRDAELKSLKSQINPHFLFNSLNSISSLTLLDPEKGQEMIVKLSDYLRFSLAHKPDELIPLREELKNIERYLDIEKTRFGERLRFHMSVPEPCHTMLVPTMILQPLFENAIKYGLHENAEPTDISVEASCSPTMMTMSIANNYDPSSVPTGRNGIGITNIRERMAILFERNDLVRISKTSNLFTITILFPLKPHTIEAHENNTGNHR